MSSTGMSPRGSSTRRSREIIDPGTRIIVDIPRPDIEALMVDKVYGWLTPAGADEILQLNGLKGTILGPTACSPRSCSLVDLDDWHPPIELRNRWTRPLTLLDKIVESI